jgi:REP element-mobilizing transposase RayT
MRYHFRVYGFVVMLEHVHLLVSEPDKRMIVAKQPRFGRKGAEQ